MIERGFRRGPGRRVAVVAAAAALALAGSAVPVGAAPPGAAAPPPAAAIAAIVRDGMKAQSLRAVVVKVTKGGTVVTTAAFGESLGGVPATTDMRFRNGAVAFAYIATLLMRYVDEHKVGLDDTIDRWMPTLPGADKVTLKMLANQTSGYPDFENDPAWVKAFYADPFQSWTFDERLRYVLDRPMQFTPGTNWSYSHTNFMILGEILSKIGGRPLDALLRAEVLDPMGLAHTTATDTAAIPEPVLHAFSSERRAALGVPSKTPFYEETTSWNSNWGTPTGANETTTIDDLATTATAVGTGKLLSPASYHAMTDPNLLGFGHRQASCAPTCFTQVPGYNYGLGVVRTGSWILQSPLLGGYSAIEAYLPAEDVGISVAVTYAPGAFGCDGGYRNSSDALFRAIAAYLTPRHAPPPSPAPVPDTSC